MDTINTSFGKPNMMWGRVVANHTFIKALAETDGLRRLTIFVPLKSDTALLRETLIAEISREIHVIPIMSIHDYLEEHPLDVLHTLDPNIGIAAHIRNFLSPNPFVITGITHSLANEHFLSWAVNANANGIDKYDCLICTTPTAKNVIDSALKRLTKNQPDFRVPETTVIPLGVSPQSPTGNRDSLRTELGFAPDEFVVLSLGRFDPLSKMDYLPILNLISTVREKVSRPIRFVLAGASGDGGYTDLVHEWIGRLGIQDVTELILDLEDQARSNLYHAADVFLTLSDNLQETFGLTVIEAMTAGLPVVASDWNGYKSLLDHGVTGYLVPTKTLPPNLRWEAGMSLQMDSQMHLFCAQTTAVDLVAAGEYLLDMSSDPELTDRMSKSASAAAESYTWENVIRRLMAHWKNLVSRRNGAVTTDGPTRSTFFRVLEDFSSYATSHLSAEDKFVTSALGHMLLERNRSLYLYGQLSELMDLKILNFLLVTCREIRSVQELLTLLRDELAADEQQGRHNIMWLYKYGYIDSA